MPRIVVANGPRAVEKALFDVLESVSPRDPQDLALPVRIIVPSLSLRLHLNRKLVAHGHTAGFLVQTLHALALEVLNRMRIERFSGSSTYEILIRRLARGETCLKTGLEHLEDGYTTVVATVRDLLDAGFDAEHEEPLLEQLEAIGPLPPTVRQRAQALIRVAARTVDGAEILGIGRSSTLMRMAKEAVVETPKRALPQRALFVHGFSDVTGVAGDFLETLLRHCDACLLLDRPEPESEFSLRLLERFSGIVTAENMADTAIEQPFITATKATNRSSEVRHVFDEIRTCLKSGTSPEAIAIVARDFTPYATLIRRHADRLGIAIASVGEQVNGGFAKRRAHCISTVLEKGAGTTIETWLESMHEISHDLLLWMRIAGISLVSDLAGIAEIPEHDISLPIVEGWTDQGATRRRKLPIHSLRAAIDRAQSLQRIFNEWPALAPAGIHVAATLELFSEGGLDHLSALERLASDIPPTLPITRDEWIILARQQLERLGRILLAGSGGGVRILNVMEARGLSFDKLFVIGLNRDHFPRIVREDPLMPDAVRSRLATILPDIPIKERGWAEERHLFAQLLSAAPQIELSWSLNEGSAPLSASPFVERLGLEADEAPELWQTQLSGIRPTFEHAILAGLSGDRELHTKVLSLALDEAVRRFPNVRNPMSKVVCKAVAKARLQALEEIDPSIKRSDLGPYCGIIGVARTGDPRNRNLSVTRIEDICSCPLQAMLTRILGIEDSRDHRLQLPDADARLVGMVIHGVLQEIVNREFESGAHKEQSPDEPHRIPWPAQDVLDDLTNAVSSKVAREAGVERAGLTPILDISARSGLENARLADWNDPSHLPLCIGAEIKGSCDIVDFTVDFRADREDKAGEGLLFTDYKNTRGVTTLRGLNTRIANGRLLQAAAYALSDAKAAGRYLYLKNTKQKTGPAELIITGNEAGVRENFNNAVRTAIKAWEIGALIPKIAEHDKDDDNSSCQFCSVQQACLRNDSGYRARLLRWRLQPPGATELEKRAHAIWWLGADPDLIPSALNEEVDDGD